MANPLENQFIITAAAPLGQPDLEQARALDDLARAELAHGGKPGRDQRWGGTSLRVA